VNELQFKLKAPFGSSVLLENNGFDLGEDHKWNGVETSSEREIWYNHYLRSSLKSKSFLNPFNSKDESGEDFVWKIKSNSIQNSARIGAMKKIEVASNQGQYGGYWKNIILEAVGVRKKYKV